MYQGQKDMERVKETEVQKKKQTNKQTERVAAGGEAESVTACREFHPRGRTEDERSHTSPSDLSLCFNVTEHKHHSLIF